MNKNTNQTQQPISQPSPKQIGQEKPAEVKQSASPVVDCSPERPTAIRMRACFHPEFDL